MSDYTVRVDKELGLLIETMQQEVHQSVVEQYVKSRKEKHMTQEDVAKLLGIKRPNITRFENGTYNPTVDMLIKIAATMDKELEIRLVDRKVIK